MADNNKIIQEDQPTTSRSIIVQHKTEHYPLFSTTMYTEEVHSYANGSRTPNQEDEADGVEETHKQYIAIHPSNSQLANISVLNHPHPHPHPHPPHDDNRSTKKHELPTNGIIEKLSGSGGTASIQGNDVTSVDKLKSESNNIIKIKKISFSPLQQPLQSQLKISPNSSLSSPDLPRASEESHDQSSVSSLIPNEEIIGQRNVSPTFWHMPKIQQEYTQSVEQQRQDDESDKFQCQNPRTPQTNAYGMLRNENEILFITESCIEIGRNSSTSMVHLHVAKNSFVSRKHFQIVMDQNKTNFYLICLSKNGVFIDNVFQRGYADPILLPKRCTFRFPSTEIRIVFESFLNSKSFNNDNNSKDASNMNLSIENSKLIYSPLKISIPKNEQKSPHPSPTGTMSAANSCPTSPHQVFQDYQNYNNYINNNNNSSQEGKKKLDPFHPPSSASSEIEKPPYSYAQLIVQAISTASDKQLTLSAIYSFISQHYLYYRNEVNKGWQNSIRHNLSLNRYFIKVARSQDEPGKGSFWRMEPTSEAKLIDQCYKKRRQRSNQCFRPLFGQPRSGPISPTHMDSSRSPENEIELRSEPVSPEGSFQYNHHSSGEIVNIGENSQNVEQSMCTDNQHLNNNNNNHLNIKRGGHLATENSHFVAQKRHFYLPSSTPTSILGPGSAAKHGEIYDEVPERNYSINSSEECGSSTNKRQKFNSSDAER